MAGALGALALCCTLAIGLEWVFNSQTAGGIGFFGGYAFGGIVGAWGGYRAAIWIRAKIALDGDATSEKRG